jgi:hypothetical protein
MVEMVANFTALEITRNIARGFGKRFQI